MIFHHSCPKSQFIRVGLVGITAGLAGLAVWIYASIGASSAVLASYPASIPWLPDQATCEKTNRSWHNEQCWDFQHDPNF